jgi:hypothetical protein
VRVAGFAVAVRTRRRPTTYLVVLDDSGGTPTIAAHESFTSDDADLATQLHETAEAVRSRLEGLSLVRVVVRRADRPPRATNAEGPKLRLLMEGAVTSAARSIVERTDIGTGAETGTWFGSNKAGIDAAATQLLNQHGLHANYMDAVSAALAALRRP